MKAKKGDRVRLTCATRYQTPTHTRLRGRVGTVERVHSFGEGCYVLLDLTPREKKQKCELVPFTDLEVLP